MDELAALPNVELAGELPHERLAARIRSFDACTIPYRLVPATRTVLPASCSSTWRWAGRSSPRRSEVIRFDAGRELVSIADAEPAGFLRAIERALAQDGANSRASRAVRSPTSTGTPSSSG